VRAGVAEELDQQFGSAVGDEVLLGETWGAVYEDHEFDDSGDVVEVADRGVQGAEQVDGGGARGLFALGGGQLRAELADPGLAIALGDVAAEKKELSGLDERHEGGYGRGGWGQRDLQLLELVVDGHVHLQWKGIGYRVIVASMSGVTAPPTAMPSMPPLP